MWLTCQRDLEFSFFILDFDNDSDLDSSQRSIQYLIPAIIIIKQRLSRSTIKDLAKKTSRGRNVKQRRRKEFELLGFYFQNVFVLNDRQHKLFGEVIIATI